ncbi:MAG: helix-turn-helix transcriptional regulator [Pseudomonadota bacterium]|nr:helix-turn-helix transcriptional regulator [Pseudomonadota bacterium]
MGKHHPKLFNNLEGMRRQAGLTQAELSKFAGVSRKSINAVENGMYVPSTVLALKIADILGCSVEDLFRLPSS